MRHRNSTQNINDAVNFSSFSLLTGETVKAEQRENVTMLFSDIVGFTSICSTATPLMVIDLLNNLYTRFDNFCGELDVYKVSKDLLDEFLRGIYVCVLCGRKYFKVFQIILGNIPGREISHLNFPTGFDIKTFR